MMIKSKYLIVFIALLIIGMSVAVAADADDSTSTTKKVTKDTTKIVKNTAVTKKATKTTDKKTTKAKENIKTKNTKEKTITKNTQTKTVKRGEAHEVNESIFDELFTPTGLGSSVGDGDTLYFTANITRNASVIVDKPVNITTYDNSVLSLNTTSGSYFGNETGNAFNIIHNGSYTNITNTNPLGLNKRLLTLGKTEGESKLINITESNFEEWFGDDPTTWELIYNNIDSSTIFNITYVPETVTNIFITPSGADAIKDYTISFMGNNLTLNNVMVYIKAYHFVLSDFNLVYNESYVYDDDIGNDVAMVIGDMGNDYSFLMNNVNVNFSVEYDEDNPILQVLYVNQPNSNITYQNSEININVPVSDDGIALFEFCKKIKFINNTINIKEKYKVGDNPSITVFYAGQSNPRMSTDECEFENNIISIDSKWDVSVIQLLSSNHIINNNTITITTNNNAKAIELTGNSNTITNNNIIITSTPSNPAIELTGDNNLVTSNAIVVNDVIGDDAVVATGDNNVVQGNGPMVTELTVINPSVANVNEVSPMTVVLKDANGNLLANQDINVTVGDDSEIIKTDDSGIAVYEFLPTTSGSVDVVFNYLGGGMFLSSNKTVTVTVNEDKDAIIEELNKTIQEQKETIASNEEDIEDLNNIIEEQDDEIEDLTNITQALNNTVAQLEKDLTQAQEQLANNNNTNTNGTSNTNTTTPTKTSVTLKLNPTTLYTGSKTKITATLKDANGKEVASQKISIKVGSKTYTVKTNKKGVATKTVKVTKTGKNKVTATFKATSKYAKATKSATISVKAKEKTKISVSKLSYKNKKITIKATIKAGKKALTQNTKLTIKVDGKVLTSKKVSKKGKISLTLKKALKKGSHKVQIISKATSMYKQSKVTKTLKV